MTTPSLNIIMRTGTRGMKSTGNRTSIHFAVVIDHSTSDVVASLLKEDEGNPRKVGYTSRTERASIPDGLVSGSKFFTYASPDGWGP